MARLWATGFELNATLEYLNATGTIAFSTTTVRSGTYSLQIGSLSSGVAEGADNNFRDTTSNGPFFQSVFINIATLPSAENRIIAFRGGTTDFAYITLDSAGALLLYDEDGVIGSASSAISTDTWTKIDLKFDKSPAPGSHVVEGRLNDSVFATASNRTISGGVDKLRVGGNLGAETQTIGSWFFDDWKVNDIAGGAETSYPGTGKITHQKPDAVGDASDWTNDYTAVDEVTPDDAATFAASNTLNQIDDHNLEASSIGDSDTVNLVNVGMRISGAGASANATYVLRIKASAGGTVEESVSFTPSNATWRTNRAGANPVAFRFTLYDLPGASTTAWTKADLDTTQIGYRLSATSTNAAQISTVWLLVDYAAAGGGTPSISTMLMMGV